MPRMVSPSTSERRIVAVNLGRTDYEWCWSLQQRICVSRAQGRIGDVLLFTEHEHVYTIGRAGNPDHLLARDDELRSRRISVHYTDRGGDITYHGPGQLVGYPILDLHGFSLDLHRYLRDIEEAVIRTLSGYGIHGRRLAGYTGVWVGNEKICAIGIKSARWITMHGFALNVSTDLSYFRHIIPCGIFELGVTSMQEVLGRPVGMDDVMSSLIQEFESVFGVTKVKWTRNELIGRIAPAEAVTSED